MLCWFYFKINTFFFFQACENMENHRHSCSCGFGSMISEHLKVSQCKMAILQWFGKRAEKAGFDWKWIPRPLEIFSLLLIHRWKRNGNFYLSPHSCQSLAGKQNTTQLLSGDLSSYSLETFDVRDAEQCWASTASVAPLVGLAHCVSASGLRQLLDK